IVGRCGSGRRRRRLDRHVRGERGGVHTNCNKRDASENYAFHGAPPTPRRSRHETSRGNSRSLRENPLSSSLECNFVAACFSGQTHKSLNSIKFKPALSSHHLFLKERG